ncbi:MFS general substrate transporter [Thozetella sp. PMI_491]|nr:MFS general substrate transporter [Thozetella sp. PMI_491]
MRESQDVYHPGTEPDATESTSLLGAGAQHAENGRDRHEDVPNPLQRTETWVGMEEFEGLPWYKRPSVWWLLWPFAIFTLAFGGTAVPKMNLIISLVCAQYYKEKSLPDPAFPFTPLLPGGDLAKECFDTHIQRSVTTFNLTIGVITGILSAFTAPKLGALSDRYGRKRLLVICSMGGIVGEIITILAANFPDVIHYRWIILGSVFDGLAGSFTAGSVISHAYTSDCTPPSKRSVAFGYLHSCLFIGMSFGPLLTGYFVEWTGSLVSIFYLTLGCHITFISFIWFVIPESLTKSRQRIAREKHALEQARRNPGGVEPTWMTSASQRLAWLPLSKPIGKFIYEIRTTNLFAPLKILFPTGPGSDKLRRNLITLALIDMSIMGAVMGAGPSILMYTEYIFGWRNLQSSQFMSMVSMVRVFILLVIFPCINYWFRVRPAQKARRESGIALVEKNNGADKLDIWILRVALMSDVLGVAGYIFVRTSELFVACAVITAFGGLGSATIQASTTKHVPAERVGQLLGAIGLLHALARIFLPVIFGGLYAVTVGFFPQAFFVLLCSVFVMALSGSFLLRPHVYMEDNETEPGSPIPQIIDPVTGQEIIDEDEIGPGMR